MEFFNKAKAVRLRSHLGKYLVADDDEQTVRQSRNSGSSRKARWTVELVESNAHVVRLKSCHGKYLTASDDAFLLGMTGRKVVQDTPTSKMDVSILWEPIKEGSLVKLRTKAGGKLLRGNGGTPPWRNTVTHDFPHRTATQDWVLWGVDVMDILEFDFNDDDSSSDIGSSLLSSNSGFSSFSDDFIDSETSSPMDSSSRSINVVSETSSPMASRSIVVSEKSSTMASRSFVVSKKGSKMASRSMDVSETGSLMASRSMDVSETGSLMASRSTHELTKESGMELFQKAKSVRLRSHHDKYLLADDDEETVCQDRNGSCKNAKWTVEFVEGAGVLRFKSCFGKYLTASNIPYLLGMTGKKVLQTVPRRLDSSIEWEPHREGFQVRLKTRYGQYLRANGGLPPWRNSITHDIPHRTATQDWVLWDVDIVETRSLPPKVSKPVSIPQEPTSPQMKSIKSPRLSKLESSDSYVSSPVKSDGRVIYYFVADDEKVDIDETIEEPSFHFKGNGVEELKQKLKEETGLNEDIVVCSRNSLNGKLYPLKLHLPPNNTTMHVVVVPSSSKAATIIATPQSPTRS